MHSLMNESFETEVPILNKVIEESGFSVEEYHFSSTHFNIPYIFLKKPVKMSEDTAEELNELLKPELKRIEEKYGFRVEGFQRICVIEENLT